ncbi:MAG: hypothetical protein IJN31_03935 [Peptococcaceae bacterium]|nr:hypothetical protein [Ruminococcus sp.]MBQ7025735.1 hypothetical protein [Peptococcaceae bacterium]
MERKNIVDPNYPYTYRRTLCAIKRLVCRYRGLLRIGETGSSEQGRNIPLLILGTGKRKLFLLGSIHGREYVTTGYLLRCAEEYAHSAQCPKGYGGFDLQKLLLEYSFYILPLCNPDSVEIALGRALPEHRDEAFCAYTYKNNGRNVNLNANFPFEWQAVPKERQGGDFAASERETRFIMSLCEKHSFEAALSFHTRGGCVFWRDSVNGLVPYDREMAESISRGCNLKLCPETKEKKDCAGGFENWFRYRYNRPSLCVELVSDETAPFDLACREFERYTDWERTRLIPLVSAKAL